MGLRTASAHTSPPHTLWNKKMCSNLTDRQLSLPLVYAIFLPKTPFPAYFALVTDSSWKHAFGGSFPALLADHTPLQTLKAPAPLLWALPMLEGALMSVCLSDFILHIHQGIHRRTQLSPQKVFNLSWKMSKYRNNHHHIAHTNKELNE